ncbi:UBA/TS-N domain containing protein [Trichomonas vaginalis G3]|uniref:UBA/TS-N domain containing protein n=1 Tax=Trichomonas vaginalis (strain ATCC PRA-98 / G3) TaxID=412133 RepID=A2FKU9_TRIV3|nr:UBA-like family [Trichomonas vaginalis G3]EAX94459.1 UBA/TS-N domain containing protein [Trichomonas vaginalis G3]KAI5512885.1 UBA-like family [Trichomonas vaginalis G3]|eukprot:XP_001307389.1 UBA/TS-N domain containing protein [Trichomonas vaginalis G3]
MNQKSLDQNFPTITVKFPGKDIADLSLVLKNKERAYEIKLLISKYTKVPSESIKLLHNGQTIKNITNISNEYNNAIFECYYDEDLDSKRDSNSQKQVDYVDIPDFLITEDAIEYIENLNYPRSQAINALITAKGDLQQAISLLSAKPIPSKNIISKQESNTDDSKISKSDAKTADETPKSKENEKSNINYSEQNKIKESANTTSNTEKNQAQNESNESEDSDEPILIDTSDQNSNNPQDLVNEIDLKEKLAIGEKILENIQKFNEENLIEKTVTDIKNEPLIQKENQILLNLLNKIELPLRYPLIHAVIGFSDRDIYNFGIKAFSSAPGKFLKGLYRITKYELENVKEYPNLCEMNDKLRDFYKDIPDSNSKILLLNRQEYSNRKLREYSGRKSNMYDRLKKKCSKISLKILQLIMKIRDLNYVKPTYDIMSLHLVFARNPPDFHYILIDLADNEFQLILNSMTFCPQSSTTEVAAQLRKYSGLAPYLSLTAFEKIPKSDNEKSSNIVAIPLHEFVPIDIVKAIRSTSMIALDYFNIYPRLILKKPDIRNIVKEIRHSMQPQAEEPKKQEKVHQKPVEKTKISEKSQENTENQTKPVEVSQTIPLPEESSVHKEEISSENKENQNQPLEKNLFEIEEVNQIPQNVETHNEHRETEINQIIENIVSTSQKISGNSFETTTFLSDDEIDSQHSVPISHPIIEEPKTVPYQLIPKSADDHLSFVKDLHIYNSVLADIPPTNQNPVKETNKTYTRVRELILSDEMIRDLLSKSSNNPGWAVANYYKALFK